MHLIPYVEVNGSWTLTDAYTAALFEQMQAEGTAKRVFHGGGVQTPGQFVQWLKSRRVSALLITEDDAAPLMLSWTAGHEDRRCWGNFCVFKSAWGQRTQELFQMTLDYWFGLADDAGRPIFDIILGLTPENNRLAIATAKKCGASFAGAIPNFGTNHWTGQRYGAAISYWERGNYGRSDRCIAGQ